MATIEIELKAKDNVSDVLNKINTSLEHTELLAKRLQKRSGGKGLEMAFPAMPGRKPMFDVSGFTDAMYKMNKSVAGLDGIAKIEYGDMQKTMRAQQERTKLEDKARKMTLRGWMAIMFAGIEMKSTMANLMKPAEDAVGLFDVWGALMTLVFLPAAELLLSVVLWLFEAWEKIPKPLQEVISYLGLFLLVLGTLAAFFGSFMLTMTGLSTLGTVFGIGGLGALFGAGAAAGAGAVTTEAALASIPEIGAGTSIGTEAALAGIPTIGAGAEATTVTAGAATAAGGLAGIIGGLTTFVGAILALMPAIGADEPYPKLISPSSDTYNVTNNFNPSTAPNTNGGYTSPTGTG